MRNGVWSTAYWMINPPECLDPHQGDLAWPNKTQSSIDVLESIYWEREHIMRDPEPDLYRHVKLGALSDHIRELRDDLRAAERQANVLMTETMNARTQRLREPRREAQSGPQ